MRLVFAIVGVPPMTGTAPPLTRIVPAALRLIVIAFPLASPKVVWVRALGLKLLTTAMTVPFCIGGVRLGIDVPNGRRHRFCGASHRTPGDATLEDIWEVRSSGRGLGSPGENVQKPLKKQAREGFASVAALSTSLNRNPLPVGEEALPPTSYRSEQRQRELRRSCMTARGRGP